MSSYRRVPSRSWSRRLLAGIGATVAVSASLLAVAPAASAAPSCPSGSDGSKLYKLAGIELGKSCFRWDDRKAMVADLNVDGASARVDVMFYQGGWKAGELWDSNGADNGWQYSTTIPANRNYAVGIRTCVYDRDGQSGQNNFGCTTQGIIQPQFSV